MTVIVQLRQIVKADLDSKLYQNKSTFTLIGLRVSSEHPLTQYSHSTCCLCRISVGPTFPPPCLSLGPQAKP